MRTALAGSIFAITFCLGTSSTLAAQEECPPAPGCDRCNKEIDGGILKHWITSSCPNGGESFWGWIQGGTMHGGPIAGGCVGGDHGHQVCDGANEDDLELLEDALLAADPITVDVAMRQMGGFARREDGGRAILILTCEGEVQQRIRMLRQRQSRASGSE